MAGLINKETYIRNAFNNKVLKIKLSTFCSGLWSSVELLKNKYILNIFFLYIRAVKYLKHFQQLIKILSFCAVINEIAKVSKIRDLILEKFNLREFAEIKK